MASPRRRIREIVVKSPSRTVVSESPVATTTRLTFVCALLVSATGTSTHAFSASSGTVPASAPLPRWDVAPEGFTAHTNTHAADGDEDGRSPGWGWLRWTGSVRRRLGYYDTQPTTTTTSTHHTTGTGTRPSHAHPSHARPSATGHSSGATGVSSASPYGGTTSASPYGGSGGGDGYGSEAAEHTDDFGGYGEEEDMYGTSSSTSSNPYSSSTSSTSAYGSGSSYGSGSTSSGYDSEGTSSTSYGSSYGSGSSSSSYGSSYGSSSSSSSYGSSYGSSSYGSSSYGSSTYHSSSSHEPFIKMTKELAAFIASAALVLSSMLFTAYKIIEHPEGRFAATCRASVTGARCVCLALHNTFVVPYRMCRHVYSVAFGDEEDWEDWEETDEEASKARLRPGIERALEREHNRALSETKGGKMKKSKTKTSTKTVELKGVQLT